LSTSSLPYISPHGTTGWLVRVPYAYLYDLNSKRLQYKQKLFTFLKHGSSDQALAKAVEFRDLHQIKGLEYNYRGADAGNGRQVKGDRIRGKDLPFGITHTIRYSREGKEQHFITVQACCNNVRRSKAFMYGHSRTREEAITKAKSTLAVFLSEIEDQVKLSKENL
jgi:hypothetical protein